MNSKRFSGKAKEEFRKGDYADRLPSAATVNGLESTTRALFDLGDLFRRFFAACSAMVRIPRRALRHPRQNVPEELAERERTWKSSIEIG